MIQNLIMGLMLMLSNSTLHANTGPEKTLFWCHTKNFGDELSNVVVEKMIKREVKLATLKDPQPTLFAIGYILHYARNGDIIWGSGFREDPTNENRFTHLDVRTVRGPLTREYLLKKGIPCPKVYGDPDLLMPYLFPEFKKTTPIYDYVVIPNKGDADAFKLYKNVISPMEPWDQILRKILQSKLVTQVLCMGSFWLKHLEFPLVY